MGDQQERREVLFLPGALREYESACGYCESKERGLGERFRCQVLDRLDAIGADPASFPVVHADIRETLVRRFPFAIYHSMRNDAVVIVAVHHCSQDPRSWQLRRT